MALVQDNYVVQALTANTPNEPLDGGPYFSGQEADRYEQTCAHPYSHHPASSHPRPPFADMPRTVGLRLRQPH